MITRSFEPSAEPPARPLDIKRSLRVQWRLGAAVFVLGAVLSVPAALVVGRPQWRAEAEVFVSARLPKVLDEDKEFELQSNSQYRQFVQQQVAQMTRFETLRAALEGMGAGAAAWVRPGETVQRAAERLEGRLEVRPVPDTYLVKVGLSGGGPDGLAEVVNAAVASYLASASDELVHARAQRIIELKTHRDELKARIDASVAELGKLSEGLGASVFTERYAEDHATRMTTLKTPLKARRVEVASRMEGLEPAHPAYRAAAAELAAIDAQLAALTPDPRTEESVRRKRLELDRARDRMRRIEDRLDFLEVEAKAVGQVWLSSAARTPSAPSKDRRAKLLALLLMASAGAAAAACVAVENLDGRVRSVDELSFRLGFPAMGWLPDMSAQWPPFVARDQLKRLAVSLLRDHRAHQTRVVAFAAVRPGGGTTTISLALAEELRLLGVDAAAVEANDFAPDERFGTASGDAVASFEGGGQALAARTQGGLEALRRTREMVLLDLPPLLLAPEAGAWVSSADAVVLVVDSGATLAGQLGQALELLRRMSPRAVGAVLNRVPPERAPAALAAAFMEHPSERRTLLGRLGARWVWS